MCDSAREAHSRSKQKVLYCPRVYPATTRKTTPMLRPQTSATGGAEDAHQALNSAYAPGSLNVLWQPNTPALSDVAGRF
jgi:hypothetical protein